jgi:hypothetical protein
MKCDIGENINKDKINPTHVPVHKIQEISSEINLPTLLKGAFLLLPQLWILFLNPLNMDP